MQSIEEILKRNSRVELDKAWEVSRTRRTVIALVTYFTATTFLFLIDNDQPFINALVPIVGYLLSTLSLPFIKNWWLKRRANEILPEPD